jgi:hypothetical protein
MAPEELFEKYPQLSKAFDETIFEEDEENNSKIASGNISSSSSSPQLTGIFQLIFDIKSVFENCLEYYSKFEDHENNDIYQEGKLLLDYFNEQYSTRVLPFLRTFEINQLIHYCDSLPAVDAEEEGGEQSMVSTRDVFRKKNELEEILEFLFQQYHQPNLSFIRYYKYDQAWKSSFSKPESVTSASSSSSSFLLPTDEKLKDYLLYNENMNLYKYSLENTSSKVSFLRMSVESKMTLCHWLCLEFLSTDLVEDFSMKIAANKLIAENILLTQATLEVEKEYNVMLEEEKKQNKKGGGGGGDSADGNEMDEDDEGEGRTKGKRKRKPTFHPDGEHADESTMMEFDEGFEQQEEENEDDPKAKRKRTSMSGKKDLKSPEASATTTKVGGGTVSTTKKKNPAQKLEFETPSRLSRSKSKESMAISEDREGGATTSANTAQSTSKQAQLLDPQLASRSIRFAPIGQDRFGNYYWIFPQETLQPTIYCEIRSNFYYDFCGSNTTGKEKTTKNNNNSASFGPHFLCYSHPTDILLLMYWLKEDGQQEVLLLSNLFIWFSNHYFPQPIHSEMIEAKKREWEVVEGEEYSKMLKLKMKKKNRKIKEIFQAYELITKFKIFGYATVLQKLQALNSFPANITTYSSKNIANTLLPGLSKPIQTFYENLENSFLYLKLQDPFQLQHRKVFPVAAAAAQQQQSADLSDSTTASYQSPGLFIKQQQETSPQHDGKCLLYSIEFAAEEEKALGMGVRCLMNKLVYIISFRENSLAKKIGFRLGDRLVCSFIQSVTTVEDGEEERKYPKRNPNNRKDEQEPITPSDPSSSSFAGNDQNLSVKSEGKGEKIAFEEEQTILDFYKLDSVAQLQNSIRDAIQKSKDLSTNSASTSLPFPEKGGNTNSKSKTRRIFFHILIYRQNNVLKDKNFTDLLEKEKDIAQSYQLYQKELHTSMKQQIHQQRLTWIESNSSNTVWSSLNADSEHQLTVTPYLARGQEDKEFFYSNALTLFYQVFDEIISHPSSSIVFKNLVYAKMLRKMMELLGKITFASSFKSETSIQGLKGYEKELNDFFLNVLLDLENSLFSFGNILVNQWMAKNSLLRYEWKQLLHSTFHAHEQALYWITSNSSTVNNSFQSERICLLFHLLKEYAIDWSLFESLSHPIFSSHQLILPPSALKLFNSPTDVYLSSFYRDVFINQRGLPATSLSYYEDLLKKGNRILFYENIFSHYFTQSYYSSSNNCSNSSSEPVDPLSHYFHYFQKVLNSSSKICTGRKCHLWGSNYPQTNTNNQMQSVANNTIGSSVIYPQVMIIDSYRIYNALIPFIQLTMTEISYSLTFANSTTAQPFVQQFNSISSGSSTKSTASIGGSSFPVPKLLSLSNLLTKKYSLSRSLEKIVQFLKKNHFYKPFHEAVNQEEYPDYLNIIKRPMDLSKVLKKIQTYKYESLPSFKQDIQLMINNCELYCGPDHKFVEIGKQLEKECVELIGLLFPEERKAIAINNASDGEEEQEEQEQEPGESLIELEEIDRMEVRDDEKEGGGGEIAEPAAMESEEINEDETSTAAPAAAATPTTLTRRSSRSRNSFSPTNVSSPTKGVTQHQQQQQTATTVSMTSASTAVASSITAAQQNQVFSISVFLFSFSYLTTLFLSNLCFSLF